MSRLRFETKQHKRNLKQTYQLLMIGILPKFYTVRSTHLWDLLGSLGPLKRAGEILLNRQYLSLALSNCVQILARWEGIVNLRRPQNG